jgi:hypothetical protein
MQFMLIENIRLYLDNNCSTENRLQLSDGVTPADDMVVLGRNYEQDSFVPRSWRTPSSNEASLLYADSSVEPHFSSHVGLVRLPEALIVESKRLGFEHLSSEKDLLKLRKEQMDSYISFANSLKKFIGNYYLSNEKVHQIGWVVNPDVNKKTVTINFKTGKYLGLHMDSWEGMPLSALDTAPNRICINFGKEPRYLIFVNLTMRKIYELTKAFHQIDLNTVGQDLLTITFFKHFPDYPVVRVKVNPYEAYIAPTENMIHDGNTEGVVSTDVHYTVRGYFNKKK